METLVLGLSHIGFGNLFILPMRNGNCEWDKYPSVKEFPLFILPMRNGNWSIAMVDVFSSATFYPTYEEWKHG